jgi:hypothetical protein
VEDEREPLGGRKLFEHDERRGAERVREQCLLLGINLIVAAHDRLWQVRAQRLLSARLTFAEHAEAHARDDGREPTAEIFDAARVRAAEAQPGLLYGVICLGDRAEHAVGHGLEAAPLYLEPLRQPLALVHGQIGSSHAFIEMTPETRPM